MIFRKHALNLENFKEGVGLSVTFGLVNEIRTLGSKMNYKRKLI